MNDAARPRDGFATAVRNGFARYASTRGRATRSEFWWFQLFGIGADIVAGFADDAIGRATGTPDVAVVGAVVGLGLLLPTVAVTVRRLHDTDHAGWWYCLVLTGIGVVPLLIWLCRRGTPGANRFGLNTRADIAAVFGETPAAAAGLDRPGG